ncbi:aminotransferase class I/II-fold pyridoxal phosphate-dependent enzyme [Nigerium massiliense]|uniref:aminotransferase class I/II-fold pyridoxal phosphate-dependent enzyme n=1 Tax=Nigerium massiliense TaxID=1522317 RepID=UPI0021C25EAB|nr:aminotransferase class I/II-fold pyridoxal phosphate-dependent enzyme [Nigerium massiliense]
MRFDGDPVAPIAAISGMAAQTILLNSASKTIAPGTRVGWLRAEGDVLRSLAIAKQAVGLQSPVPEQLVIARYLATCDLDAHVRRVADVYRTRRDALVAALARTLPSTARVTRPQGGMFCWVDPGNATDTDALLPRAVDNGVAWVPGYAFYAAAPNRATMRLSFVTNPVDVIDEGVRRIGTTLGR